jgi:hypothetical protein
MGARGGGANLLATAAVAAVAGLAGMAAADHARAQVEGRESAVQGALRWFTEDFLGVDGGRTTGAAGPSRRRGAGGMTRAEIDALPTRTYRQADAERAERMEREARTGGGGGGDGEGCEKQMCAICQDVFVPEDVLLRLQCFHEFHSDCITSFLSTAAQPMCPCCRHPVVIA